MCYRGEEKHGEKREERQLERERSMRREETRVSNSEGVRREKVRNLTIREGRRQKTMFPLPQTKIIFVGDATCE